MKMKKRLIALLLVIMTVFVFGCSAEKEVTAETVTVTFDVIADGEVQTTEVVEAPAETLGDIFDASGIVEGEESTYGLYITTVNGITADEDNQEWWCITKNGESLMTGADDTPVADGEKYELTLTVGY